MSSAKTVFASRPLLATRLPLASHTETIWPRLVQFDPSSEKFRDALYKLEQLKPQHTYTDDYSTLLSTIIYCRVISSWIDFFDDFENSIDGLSSWRVPLSLSHRDDREDTGTDASTLLLTVKCRDPNEEMFLACYGAAAAMNQIIVCLSNRLDGDDASDNQSVRKACANLGTDLVLLWRYLLRYRHQNTWQNRLKSDCTVILVENSATSVVSDLAPFTLEHLAPYNVATLEAFLALACAQLAEIWVMVYMGTPEMSERLISMCYRAANEYESAYTHLGKFPGGLSENNIELREVLAAGDFTHGRLRRTAAVKRYYYLALSASYRFESESGDSNAKSQSYVVMEDALKRMSKSINKFASAWTPERRQEFVDAHQTLRHLFDEYVSSSDCKLKEVDLDNLFFGLAPLPRCEDSDVKEFGSEIIGFARKFFGPERVGRTLTQRVAKCMPRPPQQKLFAEFEARVSNILSSLPRKITSAAPSLIDLVTTPTPPSITVSEEPTSPIVRQLFEKNLAALEAFTKYGFLAREVKQPHVKKIGPELVKGIKAIIVTLTEMMLHVFYSRENIEPQVFFSLTLHLAERNWNLVALTDSDAIARIIPYDEIMAHRARDLHKVNAALEVAHHTIREALNTAQ